MTVIRGKKVQELDTMLFFLVHIHVTKMGKMRELGTKPSKTKLNKTKHINKLGSSYVDILRTVLYV